MFFSKHRMATILISLTIIVFILMGISAAITSQSEENRGSNFIGILFSPVQNLFSFVGNGVSGFFGYMFEMNSLGKTNALLRDKVFELEQKNRDFENYKAENERLRQLLDLNINNKNYTVVAAEVIAKNSGNWFSVFTINKGTNDGITKNSVVLSANKGLIGYVSSADANNSRVISIIDSDCSVGAVFPRINNYAVVESELSLGNIGLCRAAYVSKTNDIALGDIVETSGLGPIFPKGLLIGNVSELQNDTSGINNKIIIKPAVDFKAISEVAVLINKK